MPLPSNDIEEFQNTNEDGTEDMWVAIVEEGICKGITRDEWNTEQNLDEPRRKQKRLAPEAQTQSNLEKRRRIETHRNRRRRTPEETQWMAARGRWRRDPRPREPPASARHKPRREEPRGLLGLAPPETPKITRRCSAGD
ncbi:hypothetical protein NDU88_003686 [Pleurodeles waltl]|uniref:Uncharacterized protein n=1 Tax=Pleurodeles waltl TaxID=8319 RepID=A0AAV7RDL8_PLEWA|nr:hypothetical protein NDU88_003686 [Pleurodeles waltl]